MNMIDYRDPVYENDKEALVLLDLIVAEFETNPMSVQCFDLRIVERAKNCIAKRKQFERRQDAPPLLTSGPTR